VRLASDLPVDKSQQFRVLSLVRHGYARPFDRRLNSERAHDALHMPAGTVIAGIFDRSGNARSLSLPVALKDGATENLRPRVPKAADVLLVLSRDAKRGSPELRCVATMSLNGEIRKPTVRMDGWERFVAVWYEVPAGAAKLDLSCNGVPMGRAITLTPGSIVTVRQDVGA